MFTVAIKEPQTDNERFNNPLGIYIVDYNISKVNEVLR
jgi:type IV secretory pathway TrbF-like protein